MLITGSPTVSRGALTLGFVAEEAGLPLYRYFGGMGAMQIWSRTC
jgi:hypothetical protein